MTEDKQMDCNPIKHRCPACQPVLVVEQERIKLPVINEVDYHATGLYGRQDLDRVWNTAKEHQNQVDNINANLQHQELTKKLVEEIKGKLETAGRWNHNLYILSKETFESVFAEYLKDKE